MLLLHGAAVCCFRCMGNAAIYIAVCCCCMRDIAVCCCCMGNAAVYCCMLLLLHGQCCYILLYVAAAWAMPLYIAVCCCCMGNDDIAGLVPSMHVHRSRRSPQLPLTQSMACFTAHQLGYCTVCLGCSVFSCCRYILP